MMKAKKQLFKPLLIASCLICVATPVSADGNTEANASASITVGRANTNAKANTGLSIIQILVNVVNTLQQHKMRINRLRKLLEAK